MNRDRIYEPIRKKIEEWIRYDDHKPTGNYWDDPQKHDEYRRWHDRDCVLAGGDLRADTMFSLWHPLRYTIAGINDAEMIRAVGNIRGKYGFLRDLIKGDNLEKLLPEHIPTTAKLSTLFRLGLGRENVFILPDRQLNTLRGRAPYHDYVPAFLLATFPGGEFEDYWSSPKAHLEWIEREHFQVFFDGDILPENIKDLNGTGDIRNWLAPKGVQAMEYMLDRYIDILQQRRNCFTEKELRRAAETDKMMCMDGKVQGYRDRVMKGDKEALVQAEDLLNIF